MRNTLAFILCFVLVFSLAGAVSAAETVQSEEIIYFEDGSYLIITVGQSPARTANSTTGFTKTRHVDAEGNLDWQIVLTGDFTYDGTTATCTNHTFEVYIYDNAYCTVSKTSSRNGPTASGTATVGFTALGFVIDKDTYSLTLTCSPTGTLS